MGLYRTLTFVFSVMVLERCTLRVVVLCVVLHASAAGARLDEEG